MNGKLTLFSGIRPLQIIACLLMLLLVSALAPFHVFAHTGLKESNPKNGDRVTETLTNISLQFETKVEKLSKFEVFNEKNESVPFEFKISGNEMSGNFEKAFADGAYQVKWSIVGEDGHPIKGQFSFTVERPKEPEAVPSPTDTKDTAENTVSPQPAKESDNQIKTEQGQSEGKPKDPQSSVDKESKGQIIFLSLLFLVVITYATWIIRRKKK